MAIKQTSNRRLGVDRLTGLLGHTFERPDLLAQALTHPSAVPKRRAANDDYERLEFLGDRVLGLVIADLLLAHYQEANTGALAVRYNALVRRETLAQVAESIGLGAFLKLSRSEREAGGGSNPTILSDAMEAVLAALFLDGGLPAASRFIRRHWESLAEALTTPPTDAKTRLQEWAHAQAIAPPAYREIARDGPAHRPIFTVEVALEGRAPASGSGRSKREAEQAAAATLLAAAGALVDDRRG